MLPFTQPLNFNLRNSLTSFHQRLLILLAMLTFSFTSAAQDSLVFKNGNYVVGEIKSMDRGVLTIETDYSKNDFTIKWKEIQAIHTQTQFLITLTTGNRLIGELAADSIHVTITEESGNHHQYSLDHIVTLRTLKNSFMDQVHASLSIGYSLTKAQTLQQTTIRSNVSYITQHWSTDLSFNNFVSTQDDAERVQRKDGGINFNYFLPHDWYVPVSVTFLSNTEQKIDLRLLGKAGIGKYVLHRNRAYWGFSAGTNVNYENFADTEATNTSWEGFVGTELNLFDIGDLSLLARAVGYPSITETGRVRADFTFDTKYDLPLDFFVKLGVTVNYDNRPVEGASQSDYVFQTTFGWSWN